MCSLLLRCVHFGGLPPPLLLPLSLSKDDPCQIKTMRNVLPGDFSSARETDIGQPNITLRAIVLCAKEKARNLYFLSSILLLFNLRKWVSLFLKIFVARGHKVPLLTGPEAKGLLFLQRRSVDILREPEGERKLFLPVLCHGKWQLFFPVNVCRYNGL